MSLKVSLRKSFIMISPCILALYLVRLYSQKYNSISLNRNVVSYYVTFDFDFFYMSTLLVSDIKLSKLKCTSNKLK